MVSETASASAPFVVVVHSHGGIGTAFISTESHRRRVERQWCAWREATAGVRGELNRAEGVGRRQLLQQGSGCRLWLSQSG